MYLKGHCWPLLRRFGFIYCRANENMSLLARSGRTSRRQRGISSSIDTSDQPPSCITKDLPLVLHCNACRARLDPIGYGKKQNKTSEGGCRQLWIAGNCVSQEDVHAHNLIIERLKKSQARAAATKPPNLRILSDQKILRARAIAGYTHPLVVAMSAQPSVDVRRIPPSVSPPPPSSASPPPPTKMHNPPTKSCLGIASGNSGSILSYVASSFKNSASQLESMSREKDFGAKAFSRSLFAGNTNTTAPHGNMIAKKRPDGAGYGIFAIDCLGTAIIIGNNTKVPRCVNCANQDSSGRKFILRQHNPAPAFTPFGKSARIDFIAKQPDQATHEIQRLRKMLLNMKRRMAKQVVKREIAKSGVIVSGHRADELMEALDIVNKAVEDELTGDNTAEGTPDEKENKFEMWKVMFHRLLQVYRNGGKTKGLNVAPEMMSWSMELLARTSVNNYQEARRVMRLPALSYVYEKSGELISSANQRAFSLCIQTCQTVMKRAENENWAANARLVATALDSAGVSSGVQWDYKLKKMVGQCEGHKLQPLTSKFNLMANKLKAAKEEDDAAKENEDGTDTTGQDNVSSLFDWR